MTTKTRPLFACLLLACAGSALAQDPPKPADKDQLLTDIERLC